jgi:hypothetical protein
MTTLMGKIAIRDTVNLMGEGSVPIGKDRLIMERTIYIDALTDVFNAISEEQETIEYILVKLLEAKKIDISEYDTLVSAYLPE